MDELLSNPITHFLIGVFIVWFSIRNAGDDADDAGDVVTLLVIAGIISFFFVPGVTVGMMIGFFIASAFA